MFNKKFILINENVLQEGHNLWDIDVLGETKSEKTRYQENLFLHTLYFQFD